MLKESVFFLFLNMVPDSEFFFNFCFWSAHLNL
jgi:hypothetical protein